MKKVTYFFSTLLLSYFFIDFLKLRMDFWIWTSRRKILRKIPHYQPSKIYNLKEERSFCDYLDDYLAIKNARILEYHTWACTIPGWFDLETKLYLWNNVGTPWFYHNHLFYTNTGIPSKQIFLLQVSNHLLETKFSWS